MASTIKIKRSGLSTVPGNLYSGELAYSWVSDTLYIGIGDTTGNDASVVAIGGQKYTQLLSATPGAWTTDKALIVGSDGTLDLLKVDRLQLDGSTLSTTTTNSDLYITPNGTGKTVVSNLYIDSTGTSLHDYIQSVSGGSLVDSSEIDITFDSNTGTTSLALINTTVTAGSYGSTTAIPTFTVDSKGRLTAAGEVNVATSLSVNGDNPSDHTTLNLLSDSLNITGGEGIDVSIASGSVVISGEDASDTNKGIASFNSTNFSVVSGSVSANNITVGGNSGSATTTLGGSLTIQGTVGGAISTSASSDTVYIDVALATTSSSGIASFDSLYFNVDTSAKVSLTDGGVTNAKLANDSTTLGSTVLTLGSTVTSLDGITELTVDNLNINGNEIQSTNANGNIVFNPNGTGSIDVSNAKIINLMEPVDPQDAATKHYVDNAVSGLTWKTAVNLLADSNIALTGDAISSPLQIDGHSSLGSADSGLYRILLTGQNDSAEDGIYTYTQTGNTWTLVRPTDADTPAELVSASVWVLEGTVYANTGWTQSNHYITTFVGQNWVQFSGAGAYIAGAGLGQNGTEFYVKVATSGGIEIVSDELQLKSTVAGDGLDYQSGVLNVQVDGSTLAITNDKLEIASTYVGQTSITTLGTITTGNWNGNTISEAYGGTGKTSYSGGDLLYGTSLGKLSRLAIGNTGEVLQVNSSGLPTWGAIDGGTY